jgi:hypothetical protein
MVPNPFLGFLAKFIRVKTQLKFSPITLVSRPRHSIWKNGCDPSTVVRLHENWTLALRFQVSGVRGENAKSGLKPLAQTWLISMNKLSRAFRAIIE